MFVIDVIGPVGPEHVRLALQPADEAVLAAVGVDLDVGQDRVAEAVAEAGDAVRGALLLDRGRQIRVGALDGQAGLGRAGVGLVAGLHLRDVGGDVQLRIGGDVVADAGVAVDPLQSRLQRRARSDVARLVAADAEADVAADDVAACGLRRHAVRAILEWEGVAVDVERGALQRTAADQAVARVLIGLAVIAVQELRRRPIAIAGVDQRRSAIPVAAARQVFAEEARADALVLGIFAAEDHVELVVGERLADRELRQHLAVVTIGRDAGLEVALETGETGVGDEVDDAAHRVRAVGGRRAAGDDVDALDQQLRELADIGHAGHVRADDALAVEQGERTDRAEAAQRQRAQALLAARRAERPRRRAGRPLQRGQLDDSVEDVRLGVLEDLVLADHGRRGRGVEAVRGDARAGDDDVPITLRLGRIGGAVGRRGRFHRLVRRGGIGRARRVGHTLLCRRGRCEGRCREQRARQDDQAGSVTEFTLGEGAWCRRAVHHPSPGGRGRPPVSSRLFPVSCVHLVEQDGRGIYDQSLCDHCPLILIKALRRRAHGGSGRTASPCPARRTPVAAAGRARRSARARGHRRRRRRLGRSRHRPARRSR